MWALRPSGKRKLVADQQQCNKNIVMNYIGYNESIKCNSTCSKTSKHKTISGTTGVLRPLLNCRVIAIDTDRRGSSARRRSAANPCQCHNQTEEQKPDSCVRYKANGRVAAIPAA